MEYTTGKQEMLLDKIAALEQALTVARIELAACRQELAEARRGNEAFQAQVNALNACLRHSDAERDRLKAELERLTLRWRTGIPPQVGWYWSYPPNVKAEIAFFSLCDQYTNRWVKYPWAGPIPEPQEKP